MLREGMQGLQLECSSPFEVIPIFFRLQPSWNDPGTLKAWTLWKSTGKTIRTGAVLA